MGVYRDALKTLQERRERIVEGKLNCIPFPFPRFSNIFPGIEREQFGIITANQKVGKSKFTDYICMYYPLWYMVNNPGKLKMKILYFTLEMSAKVKTYEFQCHLLYMLDKIVIGTKDLKSTDQRKPIPEEYLKLLGSNRYKQYADAFEDMVTFIDDVKNPTGINKYCRDFAEKNGTLYKKKALIKNEFGIEEEKMVLDHFEWNDPDCYYVIIFDNFSNVTVESGMDKMKTIDKLSKYFITLRNQLKYTIVAVQHQAQSQEGIENVKMNKLFPSADGLADCKTTSRDLNWMMGIFNPFKHDIKSFENYDITKFKNQIRFVKILDDRDSGGGGTVCPLYFNGASTVFRELPRPDSPEIQEWYKWLEEKQQH